MGYAYASGVVTQDAEDVWALVRRFDALPEWHPAVLECTMLDGASPASVGAHRRQVLANGGVATARLVSLDDEHRQLCYEMLDGPWAVRSYFSTVRVTPITQDGHAFVEWWGRFETDPDERRDLDREFGHRVYDAGVSALRRHFAPVAAGASGGQTD